MTTPLFIAEAPESVLSQSRPPTRVLRLRRVVSAILGLLIFALVAPEFGWLPPFWTLFYVVAPVVPVVCVWYGAGRHPTVEAVGWLLLVAGVLMFFLG